jgi:hypothetical protein
MKALATGLVISVTCSVPLPAQERDPSLERIRLALQQSPPVVRRLDPLEGAAPRTFSIFTLVPPTGRGEMVRVSVPVGELVSRAFKSTLAANRRRQEGAARRRVAAELDQYEANQPPRH